MITEENVEHGTTAGYMWHYRRGTTQGCASCRKAWAAYYAKRREGATT